MTPAELSTLDATRHAELVRTGQASAVSLVEAAVAGAEAVDGRLNAIIHPRFERALAEAARVRPGDDRPLAGVPIVIKDLDGALAGEPYHAGTRMLRQAGYVADETSLLIQRLVDAGAIVIGRTNTPELGLVPSTEPRSTGPTRNPWDTSRSPAGSSGGSAAAVAAGVVAVGHAGDGGGSIRLPASSCGLVGLKPSRGRVPTHPDVAPWSGLVARLAVTRTVRDTALVLDVASAPDSLDSPEPARPTAPFVAALDAELAPLRIGVVIDGGDVPVDPAVVAAVRQVADLLAGAGHHVEELPGSTVAHPDHDATGPFLTAFGVWTRAELLDLARRAGTTVTPEGVEAHTWALFEAGAGVDGAAYASAVDQLHHIGRLTRARTAGHDVIVTPTCPELPWTLGQFASTADDPFSALLRSTSIVHFTAPFNISGQPAISVPAAHHDGVPVGVQLVGRWGAESVLLQLAALIERLTPWSDRRPPVHV